MFTDLIDRRLWFDGDMEISPTKLDDFFHLPHQTIFTTHGDEGIMKYNKLVPDVDKILSNKNSAKQIAPITTIPEKYRHMDIKTHIFKCFDNMSHAFSESERNARSDRILEEWDLYEKYDIVDILKIMAYVVDKMTEDNVVWGCGRGSSVSSYILFVLGVHDIDSVLYELDYTEFFN